MTKTLWFIRPRGCWWRKFQLIFNIRFFHLRMYSYWTYDFSITKALILHVWVLNFQTRQAFWFLIRKYSKLIENKFVGQSLINRPNQYKITWEGRFWCSMQIGIKIEGRDNLDSEMGVEILIKEYINSKCRVETLMTIKLQWTALRRWSKWVYNGMAWRRQCR